MILNIKILLVVPRYSSTNQPDYSYTFPLGLGYISSVLKNAGYQVDCINLNHLRGDSAEILNKCLNSATYDFVCTGNTASGYTETEKILNITREHPSKPKTILGGIIITAEPDIVFDSLRPIYAVIGEGEETIVELLDHAIEGKDLGEVKGIMYHDLHGKVVRTPPREAIEDLHSIPIPDFEGFDFHEQLDNTYTNPNYNTNLFDHPRLYPLLASRSCPFHCTFCYHDSKYRVRSIENIMEELIPMVKRHKINIICIYDECFATNKKRILDFCERVKILQNEITWKLNWTCQIRVESVDRELLKIMKDAGCGAISYGFESFSPVVLKSMRKHIKPEQIDRALKDTLGEKIAVQANFIFGDVAETKETAEVTLDYWKINCNAQVQLGFVQPYPGSILFEHCVKKGLIKDKLEFIKNVGNMINSRGFKLNMTDNMTDKELNELRDKVLLLYDKYRKTVRPLWIKNSGENLYSFKVKCPYCQSIVEYNNCFATNAKVYSFHMTCRNCGYRFYITDPIHFFVHALVSRFTIVAKLRWLRSLYYSTRMAFKK